MRTLVLFHRWEDDSDAVDAIAVISEVVWENAGDAEVERIFTAAKELYGLTDAPADSFRTAWVSFDGVHALFDTPRLGTRAVEPAGDLGA